MFLGPKISTVFTSRWKALAWSASVLLTAYCSIPSADDDDGKNSAVNPAVTAAVGLLGMGASTEAASPVSPWAKASPTPTPSQ